MNMTTVSTCNMSTCAFNAGGICHTPGINIGPHAECNTYIHASSRGGFPDLQGGVGACMASDCKFNDQLECKAPKVNVEIDGKHADCQTFQSKSKQNALTFNDEDNAFKSV